MNLKSYFGKDARGDMWARSVVLDEHGAETELSASVRVGDDGRTGDDSMALSKSLLAGMLVKRGLAVGPTEGAAS